LRHQLDPLRHKSLLFLLLLAHTHVFKVV
jgi:hypothetical protein